jgi:hypothetical protein
MLYRSYLSTVRVLTVDRWQCTPVSDYTPVVMMLRTALTTFKFQLQEELHVAAQSTAAQLVCAVSRLIRLCSGTYACSRTVSALCYSSAVCTRSHIR